MEKNILEKRKKEVEALIYDKYYKPLRAKEIAHLMNISRGQREDLREVLGLLVKEGKVLISPRGKYEKIDRHIFAGNFMAHADGFGFVGVEGIEGDIFIPAKETMGAMNGDKVQISIKKMSKHGKKSAEGKVIKIVEHAVTELVGTFSKVNKISFVIPDNPKLNLDIYIPVNGRNGAVKGDKVVVKLTKFAEKGKKPEGTVINIIGKAGEPGVDIVSILTAAGIPIEFPVEVLKQADSIPTRVGSNEMKKRWNLCEEVTVTIDGEDAKDLDDAITLKKENGIYTLGVHIADVTHYVTENSPLDREALNRATSVYLVDRVVPMLPPKLSNGVCSLNEKVNRLALSCIMEIDKNGTILSHKIAETVINVDKRMTYTAVNAILEGDDKYIKRYDKYVEMFNLMAELSDIIRSNRKKRGAIDFDFPESKIKLDDKGVPIEVKAYERNKATKLIEDFMLTANETIAEDYFWQELPFVYRIHEEPDTDRMQRLIMLISSFGYVIHKATNGVHPLEVQKLITKCEGTDEEALISRLALRTMQRAKYTDINMGHFGLAAKYYTHFTSPIRRYPDLQIHRIIKETLVGKMSSSRIGHYEGILKKVSEHSSLMERRAEEAERESVKLKKAEYISKYIGKEFEGVVSGVNSWGFYVELDNTIEGLVSVNSLEGYYIYDEANWQLRCDEIESVYSPGQRVKVIVDNVDMITKNIDFRVV